MANERTITIRIVNDSDNSPDEPSADAKGNDNKAPSKDAKKNKNSAKQAMAFYTTMQVVATIKQFGETSYNRYTSLLENYKSEVAQENARREIGLVANVISSTISGAIIGSKFGPIGTAIGTIVGLTTSVARNVMTVNSTLEQQNRAVHEEAYSLYFNTERAGMVNYSRGTEN